MQTTPQERFALSVAALLLVAGAGVRAARTPPPPAEWAETVGGAEVVAELQAEVADEIDRAERAATPLAARERIDPNTATATELDRLPRIGPAMAERIVEHREAVGPFRTLDDLDAVRGIGPSLLDAVAPHLTLRSAPTAPARSAGVAPRQAAAPGPDRLDLNTATAEQLEALPGIGPVMAERIIQWRAENGLFRSVDELDEVTGIGPHLLERLIPLVRVGT